MGYSIFKVSSCLHYDYLHSNWTGLWNNIIGDVPYFISFLKRNVQKNHHLYFRKIQLPHIPMTDRSLDPAS